MTYVVDDEDTNMNLSLEMDYNDKTQEVTDYRCDQCGKYFAASRSLILHKKIHSGIKPYVCPHEGCGKAFYVRAQLTRHSYSHTNVRTEKCPFKHCTSPIKLFKTKADVRQHIKNWHTLEKSELREMKLLKKVEKWKKFAENFKRIRDRNHELEEENKRLKTELELQSHSGLSVEKSGVSGNASSEQKQRRPIPAYTQFLREQYKRMKDHGEKKPFTECSKEISKLWHDLPEQEKQPYIDRFRREMEAFNQKRYSDKGIGMEPVFPELSVSTIPQSFVPSDSPLGEVMICRKCGSSDIYHSYPSNNLFRSPYTHQGLSEPSLATLNIMPDSI